MSNQPIIIEESLSKPTTSSNKNIKEETFFKILDKVEEYDSLSTNVRHKYQQAMLSLAAIKFQNPHSLNVNAHRCTPAFLKMSQNQALLYEYSQFTNPVRQDQVYPDEYQQQLEIQKHCLQKQETLTKLESNQEKQKFCQEQLLYRFNVLYNPEKVLAISNRFKQVLQLLLKQAQLRRKFENDIKE